MPFGGMLGSTFNAVFEAQMENLQDGDRFYYLTRTQGQNFLTELEQNSFAKMIMANTDISQPGPDGIRGTDDDIVARHIGVDSFADYDYVLEVNVANQVDYNGATPGDDPDSATIRCWRRWAWQGPARRSRHAQPSETNYLRFTGGEHVVVGGTSGNDTIITDFGDDGIWGDAGDDRIESGAGVDLVNGGAGNDIITDSGDTGDFLKGDEGDDVIANSNGIDILMGGTRQGRDLRRRRRHRGLRRRRRRLHRSAATASTSCSATRATTGSRPAAASTPRPATIRSCSSTPRSSATT